MSSRRRKQEVREMAARARARQIEERRPYSEICELMEKGTDAELVARIERAVEEGSDIMHHLDQFCLTLIHTARRVRGRRQGARRKEDAAPHSRELRFRGSRERAHPPRRRRERARLRRQSPAPLRRLLHKRDGREKIRDDKNSARCGSGPARERRVPPRARQLVRHEASPVPLFNPHRRRKRQPPAAVRLHARLQRPTRPGD